MEEAVVFKNTQGVVWLDTLDVNLVSLMAVLTPAKEGMIGSSLSFVKDTDSLTWNIGF